MKYHIFISYPSKEYEIAKEIYTYFNTRFKVFMDKLSLKGGMDWSVEIPNAQKESLLTLAIISSNTEKGFYEKEEITRAIYLRRTQKHIIIPVVLKTNEIMPDLPFGLQNIQYIIINNSNDISNLYNNVIEVIRPVIEKFGFESDIDIYENHEYKPIIKENQVEKQMSEDEILHFFLNRIQNFSYKSAFFFAFLDIEKFTQINTLYGNKCGDEILLELEKLISDVYNPIFCHRLFSDEFCMLIPKCNIDDGIKIMEKLQKDIFLHDWNEIANGLIVASSIGVSMLDQKKEYTRKDVKNSIIKAAIGCKTIDKVIGRFNEATDPNLKLPVKFPRIKKGPKHITHAQSEMPLKRYSS